MKKSNWIVLALLVVISIFLLWLWYFLGFNKVDNPFDLVLSIVWWLIIFGGIVAIWHVEKTRRERVRTIYVSSQEVFNTELGRRPYAEPTQLVPVMSNILGSLKYDFTKNDLPDKSQFPVYFLVRTAEYSRDTWEGEVIDTRSKRETPFRSKEELFQILSYHG